MSGRTTLWAAVLSVSFVGLLGAAWWADDALEGSEPTVPAALTTGREQISEAVEHGDCAELRRNIVRWRDGLERVPPGSPAHDIPAILADEATDAHRELGCRSSAVERPERGRTGPGSVRIGWL